MKILDTINNKLDKQFSPKGKKTLVCLIVLAIIAVIFLVLSYTGRNGQDVAAELPPLETVDIVEENGNEMTEVDIDMEKTEDTLISFSVEDYGRSNPFLPPAETVSNTKRYGVELMAPPETLIQGSEAARIVATKVSGIMYDSENPAAILNIEGSDYMVRAGDYINNYKVLSIGKEIVTVQLGANVYKAGVGEVISNDQVYYNDVYNLENKFGGAGK